MYHHVPTLSLLAAQEGESQTNRSGRDAAEGTSHSDSCSAGAGYSENTQGGSAKTDGDTVVEGPVQLSVRDRGLVTREVSAASMLRVRCRQVGAKTTPPSHLFYENALSRVQLL